MGTIRSENADATTASDGTNVRNSANTSTLIPRKASATPNTAVRAVSDAKLGGHLIDRARGQPRLVGLCGQVVGQAAGILVGRPERHHVHVVRGDRPDRVGLPLERGLDLLFYVAAVVGDPELHAARELQPEIRRRSRDQVPPADDRECENEDRERNRHELPVRVLGIVDLRYLDRYHKYRFLRGRE